MTAAPKFLAPGQTPLPQTHVPTSPCGGHLSVSRSERLTSQLLFKELPHLIRPHSMAQAESLGPSVGLPFSPLHVQPICKSGWLNYYTLSRIQLLLTAQTAAPLLYLETKIASELVPTSTHGPCSCSPHSQRDPSDLDPVSSCSEPSGRPLSKRSLDNG